MKHPFRANIRPIVAAAVLMVVPAALAEERSPVLDKYRDKVEPSIERGLAWLAKEQMTSEAAQKLNKPFLAGSIAQRKQGNTGITSLSVMAFLAKGHTPGLGPYGETINRGIEYITSQQQPNGLLVCKDGIGSTHGHMYSHSISTLMLAEASGMVDPVLQKKINEALPKALALILNAQQVKKGAQHAGGWRYQPTSQDSDMSLTGWAIMALRAGKMNGAPVPNENIENAITYVLKCRHPQNGGFGYTPGSGPKLGLTGSAVLCLELCGQHGHEAIEPAGKLILQLKPARFPGGMHGYYDIYYASQASFQIGGKHWEEFAPWMYEQLLAVQQPGGEWPPADGTCGSCYTTSMAILAMTPPYRQLPIYQRDDDFEEEDLAQAGK